MSPSVPTDVYTVSEVARAAGVPVEAVRVLLGRGDLQFVPGTGFIFLKDPSRIGARLRHVATTLGASRSDELFSPGDVASRETRQPLVASLLVHATLVGILVWLSSGRLETAAVDESVHDDTHLVFLLSPGPGGGGGGGGLRQPRPAPKIARRGTSSPQLSVPQVSEKPVEIAANEAPKPTPVEPVIEPPPPTPAPEPVPAKVIVAPVQSVAANERDRDGAIEHATEGPDSHGSGSNGGVGSGQGTGNGEGLGSGIGDGEGGGTGGGPYRPGSGIEPPRLLHEVKADYTEDARRRNITGDVLLEIVVRRDGGVGNVRVLQGLGYGLEDRAIAAVRQWRFSPAQRKGVPVDVVVEVAVEFTLR